MMKRIRFLIEVFTCIVLTLFLSLVSTAFELVTEKLSDEDRTRFVEEYDFQISNASVTDLEFSTFDVNSKGEYFIGFIDYEGRGFDTRSVGKISVYSPEDDFISGIVFNTPGAFNAYWNGENINIYSHRDNILLTIDTRGSLIDVKNVPNTDENTDCINNKLKFKTKTVNGITYNAKTGNSLIDDNEKSFSGQYSKLIRTNEQGVEKVIYENETNDSFPMIYLVVIIILAILVSLVVVVLCFKRSLKSNKTLK